MPAPNTPMTFDRLKTMKKPRTKTVRIPTDSEVADKYEEAKNIRDLQKMLLQSAGDDGQAARITKELEKAEEEYQTAKAAVIKASVKFTFRAIGRVKYDKLVSDNPQTDEQKEEADKLETPAEERVAWNPDKFPPALITASIVEPKFTKDQITEMWNSDDWSTPELVTLFQAAMEANSERHIISLGKD